jgi:HD-GYP domain-containing protein (c-di-GMP phosphodiesterase class II)
MENLSLLASVHDIGKVAISEDLLNKNDKLTEKEQEEIKSHTQKGYNIIKLIPSFSPILGGILSCHENWDGSGYPDGKKEDEIPLASRIVFLADSFDIMTRERPYKKAMTEEQSIVEIERCSGKQFDPALVKIFVEVLRKENENNSGRQNLSMV